MEDFQEGQEKPDMALNEVLGVLQDMGSYRCHLQLFHGAQAEPSHAA